jgi:hypothetical protein
MLLTETQSKKVIAAINNKIKWDNCSVCKHPPHYQSGTFLELREYNEGVKIDGAPITPLIPVYCKHCGHTQLFSAIMLGLVDGNGKVLI